MSAAEFERLHAALQAQDLDRVVELLDPEVEVTGMKGTFRGPEAVRRWLTPSEGGTLSSRIELDEIREVGGEYVAIGARRLWHWRENDELADESGFGALFRFRDGRLVSWRQDFGSIVDAIEAIPREHHAP
jgi:ketosteroid isomerase-like protein